MRLYIDSVCLTEFIILTGDKGLYYLDFRLADTVHLADLNGILSVRDAENRTAVRKGAVLCKAEDDREPIAMPVILSFGILSSRNDGK